jgi:hypothetical protein
MGFRSKHSLAPNSITNRIGGLLELRQSTTLGAKDIYGRINYISVKTEKGKSSIIV